MQNSSFVWNPSYFWFSRPILHSKLKKILGGLYKTLEILELLLLDKSKIDRIYIVFTGKSTIFIIPVLNFKNFL